MNFQQMKLGTNVIPHFHIILTGQSISEIIWFDPKSCARAKGKFQSQVRENIMF